MTLAPAGSVIVIGSVNLDLVLRSKRLPVPGETVADATILEALGGKGANQALAAARMGASVSVIACVGDDDAGGMALGILEAEGIDTTACRNVPEATGRAAVLIDAAGRNLISVGAGANACLSPDDVLSAWPGNARVLLTQLEIPPATASAAITRAKRQGLITCLNVTPASRFHEVKELPTILVANRNEAEELTGTSGDARQLAVALSERFGATAVVTDGASGAAACHTSEVLTVRAPVVKVLDTTCAGDAFAGTLAASLAENVAFDLALERACFAGAIACTVIGAEPSVPTRERVLAAVRAQTV